MSGKNVLTRSKKQKAMALFQSGQIEAAKALFEQVCRTDPSDTGAWGALGVIHGTLEEHEAAASCCQRAVTLRPDYAEAYNNLGAALTELGRLDEAIASHRRVLQIDPDHAGAHYNLGNALSARGHLDDAIACYREALRLQPNDVDAWVNMGQTLHTAGSIGPAIDAFQRALRIDPNCAEARNNLGVALAADDRLTEADAMYRQATRLKPEYVSAWRNLGLLLLDQGRQSEAMVELRQAVQRGPDDTEAHSALLFALNYDPAADDETVFAEHERWGRKLARLQPCMQITPGNFDPERRLKIGYVSPDFRAHSVAYFIEPVLAHHNPANIETYCYAEVSHPDATTARLKPLAAHWRDTFGRTDDEMIDMIRNDGIDILVDLAGHTTHNRLPVFARKPAALQVSYLGYPNTTGLATMGFRLTDIEADPPGQEAFHIEQLARLPHGFLCYTPPATAPAVSPLPAYAAGHVTFGSFNNLAKMTPEVIAVWSRILLAVPGARIIIKNKSMKDGPTHARFLALFREAGIPAERVDLIAWVPETEGHLSLYHRVDIALDTFPYNGATTTCEALWMGVPIVTLAGNRHAARVGVSLLTRVGLTDLIAQTQEGYVDLSARLASDLDLLAAQRGRLREQMARSRLCDGAGFARDLEATYREMWQKWSKGN